MISNDGQKIGGKIAQSRHEVTTLVNISSPFFHSNSQFSAEYLNLSIIFQTIQGLRDIIVNFSLFFLIFSPLI